MLEVARSLMKTDQQVVSKIQMRMLVLKNQAIQTMILIGKRIMEPMISPGRDFALIQGLLLNIIPCLQMGQQMVKN